MSWRQRTAGVALAIALVFAGAPVRAQEVTVFAAASLADALGEIGRLYEDETGKQLRFSFASSSTLARQIEAGAPADIYASASTAWMDYLQEAGLVAADTRVEPIGNRLVLIARRGSGLGPVTLTRDTDLAALLGPEQRLAVGDPAHVPAGIYAEQALRWLGQWAALEPRLARADDVRAAVALVARGEAPLGIAYATDAAVSTAVEVVAGFPAASHEPIVYPFAMVEGHGDSAAARDAYSFILGAKALKVFRRYGFARE